jgi:hypothetical protein
VTSAASGQSKRTILVRPYDAAGAAGDPRYRTRAGVGPMARELYTQAGLARPSTARNYLHHLLDQRGIPRPQPTDNTTATTPNGASNTDTAPEATNADPASASNDGLKFGPIPLATKPNHNSYRQPPPANGS